MLEMVCSNEVLHLGLFMPCSESNVTQHFRIITTNTGHYGIVLGTLSKGEKDNISIVQRRGL